MVDPNDQHNIKKQPGNNPSSDNKQEKSDPNLTELKGFIDPKEKLEPKADKIDSEKKK